MPEIGEVARIVNRLNKHLVGKTIASIQAANDALIFKDTSADEFKRTLEGHTVLAAKQWGKYFWSVSSSLPLCSYLVNTSEGLLWMIPAELIHMAYADKAFHSSLTMRQA
jgi:formamidopyrimidine-DNA glycosylase